MKESIGLATIRFSSGESTVINLKIIVYKFRKINSTDVCIMNLTGTGISQSCAASQGCKPNFISVPETLIFHRRQKYERKT